MANQGSQSNTEVEVLDIANKDNDESAADDNAGDEVVVSAEEAQGVDENASESSQPSGDEQQPAADATEQQPPAQAPTASEPSHIEPNPVAGETERERGLRKEVERLRGEVRQAKTNQMTTGLKPAQTQVSDRMAKLQEKYTPEEIANMQEAIDVLAEANGYVRKDQTYQETVNTELTTFTSEFPEYLPQNDKDDVRWNKFQEIAGSGMYNLHGRTTKELRSIFEKIHSDVAKELGEAPVVSNQRRTNAQQQKVRSVSHATGGTRQAAPTTVPKKPAIDPSTRNIFKGFDDEDLA